MGAYNVVNRASLAAGQPEDVSQVLANLDAIAAVLNGGVDNTNLAAGILASKLANYPADPLKLLAGDGSWRLMPRITTGTFAGGPPASPSVGDIWIANVGNSARWTFQYDPAVSGTYPWQCIGGGSYSASIPAAEAGTGIAGVWNDLTTVGPTITVARAGIYTAAATAGIFNSSGIDTMFIGVCIGAGSPVDPWIAVGDAFGSNRVVPLTIPPVDGIVCAAGDSLRLRYFGAGSVPHAEKRTLTVAPVRVA